ncbi:hypothetical protein BXZ70DRAFT_359927 [Cristinia sonorae]|uniref:Uncharacterized protein n=1 Tax=Cristinia sonorae TaxID=1940300 RepID=A0A8K0XMS1_9AGAR|nr:hypothetical protein BXZ70DRAFT_359927 [Cristinia sonorae]
MARPASIASFDTAAAAEALDLFDERNASFRTSKLVGAVLGSSPRRPVYPTSIRGSPSHLRRATSEAVPRSTPSTPSRLRSASTTQGQGRPGSPDIEDILSKTPRPRRASSAVFSSPSRASIRPTPKRSPSAFSLRSEGKDGKGDDDESIFSISDYGALLEEPESLSDGEGGSESDSSLDIHTPLPHLMFRDGLLSPRSKLLPPDLKPSLYSLDDETHDRSRSVMSIASTAGSLTTTKSGLQKDPRDTVRRRQRHRDGALLRAGMGLTTGLGWSDSEDEDAPSALTRRLINTTLDRKRLSRPTSSNYDDLGLSRFASPAPMSRFASPTPSPSSSKILPRKSTGSLVGMRSLSVSQIQTRATVVSFPSTPPSTEANLPKASAEVHVARSRTLSSASSTSKPKTPTTTSANLPMTSSPRARTVSSASSTNIPGLRSRAGSVASTAASSIPGTRSRTTSSASVTQAPTSLIASLRSEQPKASTASPKVVASPPRPSLESLASTSTTSLVSESSNATSSVNSSSTASSGSVPRPLRLPQSVSARTQSQDHILASISSSTTAPVMPERTIPLQRPRALSGPRPRPDARSPTPTQSLSHSTSQPFAYTAPAPTMQRTFTYPQPVASSSSSSIDALTPSSASSSSTSYFSPMTSPLPPTPSESDTPPSTSAGPSSPTSPRQRPALIGARPKPRTGTGMAYRTSSFGNLQAQASALKMRTLASGPSPVSMAAEGSSNGYPVRI